MANIVNLLSDPGTSETVAVNYWAVNHVPATATQATITQAAPGAGLRNVCKGITVSVAAGASAQTPVIAVLRDGATGAGPILWACALSAAANFCGTISVEVDIKGSPNTAMTLEFTAAGVTASQETVAMSGVIAGA